MQMVIDIPDIEYDVLNQIGENTIPLGILLNLRDYIRVGTPLPEGHGRLIDADDFQDRLTRQRWTFRDVKEYKEMMLRINDEPTIIEADKEGSGDA